MDSCVACGCEITGDRTPAGAAVYHAGKLYCAECAAMVIPPETLKQLAEAAQPAAAASARPAGGVMSGDDILGDETQAGGPPPVPGRHETATARGVHRSSTRTAHMAGRGGPGRRGHTTAIPRSVPGGGYGYEGMPAPSGRARRRGADSTGLYLGIGAGMVALVLVGIFVFGRETPKRKPAAKPPAPFVDDDKTPSTVYAQQAQEWAAKRDVTRAVHYYGRAAERAEKEGNTEMAKKYNMQSEALKTTATVNTTGNK